MSSIRPNAKTWLLAGVLFAALPVQALAQNPITLNEPGFTAQAVSMDGSKQLEITTGVCDTCLYIATTAGEIGKKCGAGPITPFASGFIFPVGLTCGPGPGGQFGNYLYVGDFGSGEISRVLASNGVVSPFATVDAVGAIAFDPSGVYGNFLFAATAFESPIYKITSSGGISVFADIVSACLKFGPGGAWGSGMYATVYPSDTDTANVGSIRKISSTGVMTTVTSISFPEGFDWGFDGDLFATDPAMSEVYRVRPNGSKTVFATLLGAADVAWNVREQALYVASNQGGIWRVKRGTVDVDRGLTPVSNASVAPNPTRGPATLRFALASPGVVAVTVIDAGGRMIRRLPTAWRPSGNHLVEWDGRDESGRAAAPGMYLCRVTSSAGTQVGRVSVIR